jgi:hypothetical protein
LKRQNRGGGKNWSLRTICLQIKRLLTVVSSSSSKAGQGSLASLEDVGDTSDFRGAKQIKMEKYQFKYKRELGGTCTNDKIVFEHFNGYPA